ncbi:peptidoglycan recognition family protein [Pseudonocardia hispaniensis]|uniref:Peptidoglycan recognition family protein n=1 Tax=Pseudonocardia hispaniensis TaxID=904933 RepID=A0ABW1J9H9_9PSEU
MEIISRRAWGARYPAGFGPAPLPATRLYLHHSVTVAPDLTPPFIDDDAAIRTLEHIGQQRFGGGISYTFAITPVGRIYEGHGIDREGAHTKGLNRSARAICWVGNYDRDRPTPQLVAATAWLVRYGYTQGWWAQPRLTGGHRDAPGAATACPGRHAYALIGDINLAAGAAGPRSTPSPRPRGGPFMALSDDEQRELLARVRNLDHQLYFGEGGPGTPGWHAWDGGTGETLTVVDYLRRNNVEVRQAHHNLNSLHQKIDAITAAVHECVELLRTPSIAGADGAAAAVTAAVRDALADLQVVLRSSPALHSRS